MRLITTPVALNIGVSTGSPFCAPSHQHLVITYNRWTHVFVFKAYSVFCIFLYVKLIISIYFAPYIEIINEGLFRGFEEEKMMMQTRLFDWHDRFEKLNKNGDPLLKFNQAIDWEIFREPLEKIRQKERKSNAGAGLIKPGV